MSMQRIIAYSFLFGVIAAGCTAQQVATTEQVQVGTESDQTVQVFDATRVHDAVNSYLSASWPNAQVTVTVDSDGRVTLDGNVGAESDREAVETGVAALPGVERVRNRLNVAETR